MKQLTFSNVTIDLQDRTYEWFMERANTIGISVEAYFLEWVEDYLEFGDVSGEARDTVKLAS